MNDRQHVVESIANTVADYREGDVPRRTPKEIERWVSQFSETAHDTILSELDHLLAKTYISRNNMTAFLRGLTTNEKFCSGQPEDFWKGANLLDIQKGGNSQREMLAIFDRLLEQELGLKLSDCGTGETLFLYLDDGIFGGGRVLQDVSAWITDGAPKKCELRIVVAALHTGGEYYAGKKISELAKKAEKEIQLSWWRLHTLENRLMYKDESDVLWPTKIPSGALAEAYVKYLAEEEPKYKPQLRSPGSIGRKKLFSSDEARVLLEREFLAAGLHIRDVCPLLPEFARPLGTSVLKTLGFGSTIVTFRNCPNNSPLALWAGDPWVPLFPRSTNSEAFLKRSMESISLDKKK